MHPNVDKKSFIRAKQAQIHQERDHRRHQIKTLKYERIINDGLTARIDRLLTALKSHKDKLAEGGNEDQLVFQAMMESMLDQKENAPPPPPEGVHEHIKDKPTYPQMMASMVDIVKKEIDSSKSTDSRYDQFIVGLQKEKERVEDLQRQLLAKLAELEKEDKRHITSDDIKDGFSYSAVKKEEPKKATSAPSSSSKTETVELLNAPKRPEPERTDTGDSGADADVEEGTAVDDEDVEASPLAKKFAAIKAGDWYACLQFLMQHSEILKESETDGLLVEAGSGLMTNAEGNLGAAAPSSAGVPAAYAALTLVLDYNDPAALDQLIQERGPEIAAVIFEPVVGNAGVLIPTPEFLATLQRVRERGALLIALDANRSNELVDAVLTAASWADLDVFSRQDGIKQFRGEGAEVKNALFNWGLGAIAWLVVGRILDRIVKP